MTFGQKDGGNDDSGNDRTTHMIDSSIINVLINDASSSVRVSSPDVRANIFCLTRSIFLFPKRNGKSVKERKRTAGYLFA